MQNLYPYTRYFQPSKTYNEEFLQRFLDGLNSVDRELLKNPLEITPYSFKEFEMPYGLHLTHYYYNILVAIAKCGRVKLMWRLFLSKKTMASVRGLYIIGGENRIELVHHILTHYMKAEIGYANYIKENKRAEAKRQNFGNIRLYTSKLIEEQRNTITNYINNLLANDSFELIKEYMAYIHKLENYILEQYDLDFKKYNAEKKIYYHTITNNFVHKRMLL